MYVFNVYICIYTHTHTYLYSSVFKINKMENLDFYETYLLFNNTQFCNQVCFF